MQWVEDDENMHGYMLVIDDKPVGSVRNMGRLVGNNGPWRVTHYGHGHMGQYAALDAAKAALIGIVGKAIIN